MTKTEEELSKKLLNTQILAMQAIEIVDLQRTTIECLARRIDRLEAVVEGMCVAKGIDGKWPDGNGSRRL